MISSWKWRRAARHAGKNRDTKKSISESIPTPRMPVISSFEESEILSGVAAARRRGDGEGCLELVAKIKALVKESERNRRSMVAKGTGSALSETFEAFSEGSFDRNNVVLEEILSALTLMFPLDEEAKSRLSSSASLDCIVRLLKLGDLSARRNGLLVLREIVSSNQQKIEALAEIEGTTEALLKSIKNPICPATTKTSLMIIYYMVSSLSPSRSTIDIRARFVEMGMVSLLLEMLVDAERSTCERALGILDGLCSYDKGSKEAYHHAITMPVLVKKILRVSDLATEFSVSILWKLIKVEEREKGGVLFEALEVGAFQKLLLLLQVGCGEKTKEKACDLLKLLNLHRDRLECIDSMDFKGLKRTF
ncbi:hypothetical protein HYC85_023636 [Camellia sinensis]|uniref:U-box domain-containing protein n=1 Tax=Camellia sinensis TaxID=4442 RepID=A0A7J7GFV5_CAMSI|nr:hypothetical protein HYC85_023636 [Camellia sinensis]